MTVCIAALADVGKSLVLASDNMLSTAEVSGDNVALKCYPLSDRYQWWSMMAANDVTHVVPVIESVVLGMLQLSDATNTRENVERIFVSAYQAERLQHAEDLVLAPLGLNFGSLRDLSWESNLIEQLQNVNLGCEFLVAGFDWAGDGYIFSVEHPGFARNHNVSGYMAIGSGAFGAISSLLFHSLNFEMELARILYHVCEAKFMAEAAPGVGRHTHVSVARGNGRMDPYALADEVIHNIRREWEQGGRPRVPPGVVDHLRDMLRRHPSFGSDG